MRLHELLREHRRLPHIAALRGLRGALQIGRVLGGNDLRGLLSVRRVQRCAELIDRLGVAGLLCKAA